MKLFPAIVTLHLLGGRGAAGAAVPSGRGYQQAASAALARRPSPRRCARWLIATIALLWLQIALGGWVSTNYAVLACTQFPTCQGSWWPAMDFAQGFELWRELGKTAAGEHIDFAALTAIHYAHRLMAYVVFAALAVAGLAAARIGAAARAGALDRWPGAVAARHRPVATWCSAGRWLAAVLAHRRRRGAGGGADLGLVRKPRAGVAPCRPAPARAHEEVVGMSAAESVAVAPAASVQLRQFYALTKPRVVQLIVFCALIGMVLAVPGVPTLADLQLGVLACLGIWLVAGAAAAFNCLVEKGIDAKMKRTAWRADRQAAS